MIKQDGFGIAPVTLPAGHKRVYAKADAVCVLMENTLKILRKREYGWGVICGCVRRRFYPADTIPHAQAFYGRYMPFGGLEHLTFTENQRKFHKCF